VLRGTAEGLSDHHLVVANVKVGCRYVRRPRGNGKEIVRVNELNKEDCRRRYEKIREEWSKVTGSAKR